MNRLRIDVNKKARCDSSCQQRCFAACGIAALHILVTKLGTYLGPRYLPPYESYHMYRETEYVIVPDFGAESLIGKLPTIVVYESSHHIFEIFSFVDDILLSE